MPDVTVLSPAVVVPADRLTLGANDARRAGGAAPLTQGNYCANCMAEE